MPFSIEHRGFIAKNYLEYQSLKKLMTNFVKKYPVCETLVNLNSAIPAKSSEVNKNNYRKRFNPLCQTLLCKVC